MVGPARRALTWSGGANSDRGGEPILTADKLPILHAAVLEQCDAEDGLKDGLVSDPVHCHPDLSSIECRPGEDANHCLTAAQVKVAQEIYQGAHDQAGHRFVISGPLPGSELNWVGVYVPAPGQDRIMSAMMAEGTIKYLASDPNPPASYTLGMFAFTPASFAATTRLHGLYDATDPDLSAFEAAGGKLILWHGLADPHISPLNTVAYYDAMQRLLGAQKVRGFVRMFLFPGGGHCAGGQGPFEMDLMSAIMGWVERGKAPEVLIASHRTGVQLPGRPPSGPVDRTRPVFAFPLVAHYVGHGSIDEASSFVSARPDKPWPSRFDWLGASFYRSHYEMWCNSRGAHLDCRSKP